MCTRSQLLGSRGTTAASPPRPRGRALPRPSITAPSRAGCSGWRVPRRAREPHGARPGRAGSRGRPPTAGWGRLRVSGARASAPPSLAAILRAPASPYAGWDGGATWTPGWSTPLARSTAGRCGASPRICPDRDRTRSASLSPRAASAGPTCISPRATCAPRHRARHPGPRGRRAWSTSSVPAPTAGAMGDRVGVPWLAHTCGVCRFCTSDRENLCIAPRFTGWDVDGGYAEYAVVDEAYAYALPDAFGDLEAAPLLCAGIIGYRALRARQRARRRAVGDLRFRRVGASHRAGRAGPWRPRPRDDPFGRRRAAARPRARGRTARPMPTPRRPNRSTRPSSSHPSAPSSRRPWPRSTAAARWPSPASISATCPPLDYERHLFEERTLQSVTANTRHDGEDFLAEAARIGSASRPPPTRWTEADAALRDLAHDRVNGAAVLVRLQERRRQSGQRPPRSNGATDNAKKRNADGAPVD